MISLLIIAGGKSSRLGVDKRFVEIGGVGMLENILRKAQAHDFAEKFLCVEEDLPPLKILSERYVAKILVDEIHEAGAKSVAVVSPNGWFMIQRTDERENFLSIAEKMTGVDLILTESRTRNFFTTISLWRGRGEVVADENVAAIFTSEPQPSNEIAQFDLNDIAVAEKLCKFLAACDKKGV